MEINGSHDSQGSSSFSFEQRTKMGALMGEAFISPENYKFEKLKGVKQTCAEEGGS
jgi:hypothetical protein